MVDIGVCGCGKPARYIVANDPLQSSCNKYARCKSYDDLREENKRLRIYLNDIRKWAKSGSERASGNTFDYDQIVKCVDNAESLGRVNE